MALSVVTTAHTYTVIHIIFTESAIVPVVTAALESPQGISRALPMSAAGHTNTAIFHAVISEKSRQARTGVIAHTSLGLACAVVRALCVLAWVYECAARLSRVARHAGTVSRQDTCGITVRVVVSQQTLYSEAQLKERVAECSVVDTWSCFDSNGLLLHVNGEGIYQLIVLRALGEVMVIDLDVDLSSLCA